MEGNKARTLRLPHDFLMRPEVIKYSSLTSMPYLPLDVGKFVFIYKIIYEDKWNKY